MPLPVPEGEQKEKFMNRCMADPVMVKEYPDNGQRYAICNSQWEGKMKFSGFGDWVQIFKGGKQVDSSGTEHDGDKVIDKAVATFDAAMHEPPVVIGHPATDDPAYGWIQELKSTVIDGTKYLLARFRDVVPQFEAMVREGLFKKRSAAFYPDGRLRHVGFLGAAPPAVKGLADVKFKDEAIPVVFEIAEFAALHTNTQTRQPDQKINTQTKGGMTMFKDKLKNFLSFIGVDASKVPDDALPDDIPQDLKGAAFTEADLEKAKNEGIEEGKKQTEKTFAEKEAAGAKEKRDKEITAFVDQQIKDGKLPPSWKDAGIVPFMQTLDAGQEIAFAEGKDKKTAYAWFTDFLSGFGKQELFEAIATKEKAGESAEFAEAKKDEELGKQIASKVNPAEKK